MAEEESVEDWNDKNCLSYDFCMKYSDEKDLHCEPCGHKQHEVEPDLDYYYMRRQNGNIITAT